MKKDIDEVIHGLKWVLEDDRFGFGKGLTHPETEEEQAGVYIKNAIDMLKEYKGAKPLIDSISDAIHDTAKIFRQ